MSALWNELHQVSEAHVQSYGGEKSEGEHYSNHDIQIPCKFRVYLLAVLITTLLVECPKFFEIVGNEDDKGRYSLK